MEYLNILIHLSIGLILSIILFGLSWLVGRLRLDTEKLSAYECGFDPFGDSRQKFSIQFYLVGILFILFDLEISLLFPWTVHFYNLNLTSHITAGVFLILLSVGFLYEWLKGGLNWQ